MVTMQSEGKGMGGLVKFLAVKGPEYCFVPSRIRVEMRYPN